MKKYVYITIWILVGIITSLSLAAMHLTKSFDVNKFYDVGEVREYYKSVFYWFQVEGGACYYDGIFRISGDDFQYDMPIDIKKNSWNYMCIEIEDSSQKQVSVSFDFYNKDNPDKVKTVTTKLEEGMNCIKIRKKKFNAIKMRIANQAGTTFKVSGFQFRDQKPIDNWGMRFIKGFLFFGVIYWILSILFWKIRKKQKFLAKEFSMPNNMVFSYVSSINIRCTPVIRRIPDNIKRVIRSIIFLLLILLCNLYANGLLPGLTGIYKTFLLSVILLALGVLCLENSIEKQNWNTGIAKSWFFLIILMTISDFFVQKKLMYNGIILFFVFGFVIFAWNSMKDKNLLISEFVTAMHIYFVLMTIFCFVCRPASDARYLGSLVHPVTFAQYISFIAGIALVKISDGLSRENFEFKNGFYLIEFLIAFFFTWKSQTRNGIFVIFSILLFVIVRQIVLLKHKKVVKNTMYTLILLVVLFVPVTKGADFLLEHLPHALGTIVEFKADTISSIQPEQGMAVVYAEDSELFKSRFFESFKKVDLEGLTSGRTLYWKEYLRRMNLFGHRHYAKIMGETQNAHSSLFMVPYRFGVYSIIPYVLLCFFMFKESIKYAFIDISSGIEKRNCLLPLSITVGYGIFAALDVAEYLYSGFVWIAFYLFIGMFFCKEREY